MKSGAAPKTLLLVDDHILFRQGLATLLDQQPDFQVVGDATSAAEAIPAAARLKPDLVLLDLELPDANGLDILPEIQAHSAKTRVVILTVHAPDEYMLQAISRGALGYIAKNTPVASLLASLRGLSRGEPAITRKMTRHLLDEFSRLSRLLANRQREAPPNILSPRELEVLELLGQEASNSAIAARLTISEHTVKIHVHNILSKLNMPNRHEAARFARRQGQVNLSTKI